MQSFFTLRRALLEPLSAPSTLLNDGTFRFASRFFASAGGELAKPLTRNFGRLGMNALLARKEQVAPSTQMLSFRSYIHSVARREFDQRVGNSSHGDFSSNQRGSEEGRNSQGDGVYPGRDGFQMGGNTGPIEFSANRRDFGERRNSLQGGYSTGPGRFQMGGNFGPMNFSASQRRFEPGSNSLPGGFVAGQYGFERGSNTVGFFPDQRGFEAGRATRPMEFVRGIVEQDGMRFPQSEVFHDADFVMIKLLRNNTFVSVTDSKGNTKAKTHMSAGKLQQAQGGGKLSQYSAEATAEHVGRVARELGLKSFVVKVNGFTHFKKKRQAIMSFKEGYAQSRRGENPIVYIEDTTRKAHNGCRLPRKRRI